ncbi:hypothetical protein [Caldisalinibacter kiritimatiensis]|uniref:Putative transcriptional regulator n=1 Tax=Caldisalinibacter kiritimatiensis TaxID=1304284 RepID=R1CRL2_9FIRM|nr:hypothetical protein [Caldisalinibacter kiritimatiensis]EOC99343.1 Putative transcriptional regulator [Caldisalinibacter kiritimatiensis]
MDTEKVFNKESFALLLDKAKGDRSINQYANETGVSAAHISRFLREMIDSPPTPETISKFAKYAANGVSYRDLMIAAGYISEDSMKNEDSPRNRRILVEEMEQKFLQVILADLYNKDFKWTIQKPEGRMRFPDMIIDIDHDGYKKWYIEFRVSLNSSRIHPSIMFIHHLYGQISMMELLPTDKFTIAVNDEKVYKHIFKRPPVSLRANLYVMLISLEKGKILQEEKLCDYYK